MIFIGVNHYLSRVSEKHYQDRMLRQQELRLRLETSAIQESVRRYPAETGILAADSLVEYERGRDPGNR